jgi:hypothetical protein
MRRSSSQRSIRRAMAWRREGISPCVLAQPGRPASSGSVMLHDHGFGSRGAVVMCRTRPITRPSNMATPSVPGLLSGKVRRQVMLVAFIAVTPRPLADHHLTALKDPAGASETATAARGSHRPFSARTSRTVGLTRHRNPTNGSWLELRNDAAMRIGNYPVSGAPYWLTMTGVAALGICRGRAHDRCPITARARAAP